MNDDIKTTKIKNPWRCTLLALSPSVIEQRAADRVADLTSNGHLQRARISLSAALNR